MANVIRLNSQEIEEYAKYLQQRGNQIIRYWARTYVNRLADIGISIGIASLGGSEFEPYIVFSKEIQAYPDRTECLIVATNVSHITKYWLDANDQQVQADINPILMAEFGSGVHADNAEALRGIPLELKGAAGRGTFKPNSHGNEDGWSWRDLNGNWHYSTGTYARLPIYKGVQAMISNASSIAREIAKGI